MLRRLLARLRRRPEPELVVVDRAVWGRLLELAVFGAACDIVAAEQARWLLMDTTGDVGPWLD